jgi:hypothetical protein
MHEMFPTWIRGLVSTSEADRPQVRTWHDACAAFITDATANDLLSLVRIAWGGGPPEFDERWRRHLMESDELFPLKGGENKVATLAAAAVLLASENDATRDLVLIARRCASVLDWSPATDDLLLTAAALSAAARERRSVPEWPRKSALTVGTGAALAAVDKATAEGLGVSADLLKEVVNLMSQAAGDAIVRREARMKEAVERRQAPLLEQSDILVWLLSGHCETLDQPWADHPQAVAALVAAFELSERSWFDLGRPDARTLIEFKVRSASKKAKADNYDVLAAKLPATGDAREFTPLVSDLNAFVDSEAAPSALGQRLHDELNLLKVS